MRVLQSLMQRTSSTQPTVGLELQKGGLAMVAQRMDKGIPKIVACDFAVSEDTAELAATLKEWVAKNKLGKCGCNLVLASDAYQILLVEPPDVPDEELRGAIRWRLKDLITIAPEAAAIDVFPLPEDGTKAKKRMVYVVATESARIKKLIEWVNKSSLNLNAIDIGELALRNVASRLVCDEGSQRAIAVARLRQGMGSVYIYKQNNMYLARSFNLDYNAGLLDDLPQEALALELQRSLDYFERQMGQAPPSVIYMCGDHIGEDKIGPTLRASLAIQVQILDPAAVIWVDEGSDGLELQACIGALGAALRQERV